MLETFQGGGALDYPNKYIKLLDKLCKKNKHLSTFDDKQVEYARTRYKLGNNN